ncbi:response regulator transcription factor [Lentzea flava]|uniref:Response regulator receiver domain-containing protein n=1 Tax=Lentzea flava TaxID=103732 RepID=A0ABQ2VGM7_9PSEU|nr:response regulator transcription factor [Lentzea flava]MCP2205338.1 Response regulator receiver domain-containing protein [Lentzea flava]GGU85705.1 hypothetical protein GCM10010178_89770 [Lentzea flava]
MPSVLFVEDDEAIRSVLRRALAEAGHSVVAVGTAAQALRETAAGAPDLVVLDHGPQVVVDALEINPRMREATLHGEPLELTWRELDLLVYLTKRPDGIVTRRDLFEHVCSESYKGCDLTLNVHLSRLRRKLGKTAVNPAYLHMARGVGATSHGFPG